MKYPIESNVYGSIREKKNKEFVLWKALCEIVDNSIDANASQVSICQLNGNVVITDNGTGFENIRKALIIGESTKLGKIGRYGVGLKDASIRYSNKTIIESNGVRCVADWDSIIRKLIQPEAETFFIEKTGITKITWEEFEKNYGSSIKTDMLSKVYGNLIESGNLELVINGVQIEPSPLPLFSDFIEVEFVFDGKSAKIKGGVYSPKGQPTNHLRGYNVYYKNRLIEQTREKGIGDNTTSNFCFVVDLLDDGSAEPWQLSTNKDAFDDAEEFLTHVYHKYTQEMLQKAFEKQQTIELKEWEKELQCIVNGKEYKKVDDANEARNPKEKSKPGTVNPTGSGSEHVKTNTSDGRLDDREGVEVKALTKNDQVQVNSKIVIKFEELEEGQIIDIVYNKSSNKCTVTFNDGHEEIINRKGKDAFFFKTLACSFYYFKKELQSLSTIPDEQITDIIKKISE